jgi:hypothetical protein
MPILYFLAGLLGVGIGWVIGFLDSNRNMEKKVRAAEFNAEIKIEEAEKRAELAERGIIAANPSPDDAGLLRLKRANGRYTLELDGKLVTGDLTLEMRKRLMELITVFRIWLDAAPSSQPATPQLAAPIQTPLEPAPVREAVSRPQPTVTQPVAPQAKKPEPEKNIASLSIVQQIDMVLQERLMTTRLADRGIRLQESIHGGVEVYVDSDKFETVDDVPDAEIKATIRAAIAEWEKRFTPGL